MNDLIFRYWGKARQSEESKFAYHPLPYHCLDVAAVGEVILKRHPKFMNLIYNNLILIECNFKNLDQIITHFFL